MLTFYDHWIWFADIMGHFTWLMLNIQLTHQFKLIKHIRNVNISAKVNMHCKSQFEIIPNFHYAIWNAKCSTKSCQCCLWTAWSFCPTKWYGFNMMYICKNQLGKDAHELKLKTLWEFLKPYMIEIICSYNNLLSNKEVV